MSGWFTGSYCGRSPGKCSANRTVMLDDAFSFLRKHEDSSIPVLEKAGFLLLIFLIKLPISALCFLLRIFALQPRLWRNKSFNCWQKIKVKKRKSWVTNFSWYRCREISEAGRSPLLRGNKSLLLVWTLWLGLEYNAVKVTWVVGCRVSFAGIFEEESLNQREIWIAVNILWSVDGIDIYCLFPNAGYRRFGLTGVGNGPCTSIPSGPMQRLCLCRCEIGAEFCILQYKSSMTL